jgi:hypothetical protein
LASHERKIEFNGSAFLTISSREWEDKAAVVVLHINLRKNGAHTIAIVGRENLALSIVKQAPVERTKDIAVVVERSE